MATKMNPKSSSSSKEPNQEDIRNIIPSFPEPQTYPAGWDVSSLMPPASSPSSMSSKPKDVRP